MFSTRRFPPSDHCDGRRFFNPRYHVDRTIADIWRWKRGARPEAWPSTVPVELRPPPALPPDRAAAVTWLMHAAVLVQTHAGNLLVDPVYSSHAGPFGRLGPRRVHPPAIPFEQLPSIDFVLLSHDHYDHCDLPTLRRLANRSQHTRLIAPLGYAGLARRGGFGAGRFHELDWWASAELADGLTVTATPARHWSNRLSSRRNGRLWSGYHLSIRERRLYLAGDTAYDDQMFLECAARCGAPDLAVLPIGAYEPRWFMAAQHCDPAEAVRIHRELGARQSVGVHWGTFRLTDEPREAPPAALAAAREAAGVNEAEFPVIRPGHTILL